MSRIIAGIHKGRRLAVPEGRSVRPTSDRMRERVFSMVNHHRYADMQGARVADIFAGTGALGLEALSRGASHVTFVEKSPTSLAVLRENIDTLSANAATNILRISAPALPLATSPYAFIFMDPPYREGLVEPTLQNIVDKGWLAADGTIICELATDDPLILPSAIGQVDERQQGQQRVVFLSYKPTT
ncbi:MAG: 16S rRNA (guanine(966)-N(2))-methyltransferase RsmD [Kordiimonadaceae bacterium]|nr:16S rRNA (guanine(966)-N(2))-methyltransferase RsmD [Kordiimonadaceae bacterium]